MYLPGAEQKYAPGLDGKIFKVDFMTARARDKIKHSVVVVAVRAGVRGKTRRQLFELTRIKECAFAGNTEVGQIDFGNRVHFCFLRTSAHTLCFAANAVCQEQLIG